MIRPDVSRPARLLAGPVVVAIVATLAMVADDPPPPLPEDAPAERFSAVRAMSHVRAIADRPRPAGSPRAARARDYLADTLEALGFRVEEQATEVVHDDPVRPRRVDAASVRNVIAHKPGIGGGPALALMAHYDSRPQTLGAADDASGVATLLETARALAASSPLARDLYLVFTDAEERGLLGAQAFMRQHPVADELGLVLNFEARGSSGPVHMFETSAGNGALIAALADHVHHVTATSLAGAVYARMEVDTDLSIVKRAGVPGMNFAFMEGIYDYHAPTDTAANLSMASLQQMGGYALSLARHFGNTELPPDRRADVVYFNVAGDWLVRHSKLIAHLVSALALVLVAALLWRLHRTRQARIVDVLRAAAGFAVLLVAVVLVVDALSPVSLPAEDNVAVRDALAELPLWLLVWIVLIAALALVWSATLSRGAGPGAAAALAIGLVAVRLAAGETAWPGLAGALAAGAVLGGLCRRPIPPWARFGGALLVWAAILAGVDVAAVETAYLFAWPLALAAVAAHWVRSRPDPDFARAPNLAVLLLGAVPAVFWFTGVVYATHLALGPLMPAVPATLAALVIAMLVPWLSVAVERDRGALRAGAGVAAVALLCVPLVGTGFDARHPAPSELFYWLDADSGQGYWAAEQERHTPWMRARLGDATESVPLSDLLPGTTDEEKLHRAPAPAPAIDAPRLEVVSAAGAADIRAVTVRFQPGAFGERLDVTLPTDRLHGVMLGARELAYGDFETKWWRWSYFAVPADGITLTVLHARGSPPRLYINAVRYALPEALAASLPPRPADEMPRPYSYSDATVVSRSIPLASDAR